jgi:enamine deaminase RidA (YjgF/YER057c/UK114 family)
MRIETNHWLGREFLSIAGEAPETGDPEADSDALFARFAEVLAAHGLGLENTIRSRIWAADSEARTACSAARTRTLSGPARAATSSYIAPDHLDSDTRVAMDLIALHPAPGEEKTVTEQNPPQRVIGWMTVGDFLVLPGMSCHEGGPIENQAAEILGRITACLGEAGSGWSDVCEVTFVHERSVQHDDILAAFRRETEEMPPHVALLPAEGYSRQGPLLEIETMAIMRR